MNFEYQLLSEEETQELTASKISGWLLNYPKHLDALFEVSYFLGQAKEVESSEGYFYTIGQGALIRLPYTIRAACLLIEKGFYFEAVSLVRNLYESLFQLRYFHKYPDKIKSHIMGKPRIRFKVMFEEIAPGFYEQEYGNALSEFAHGGATSSIFRTKYTSPAKGVTTMGSQYNEEGCSFSLNQIVAILFGILNYVPIFFPQYVSLVPPETEKKRKDSLAWLESGMKDHLKGKPKSSRFYNVVNPLIY